MRKISNHSAPKFVEADDAGVRFHTRLCGVGVEYNGEEEETVNNKMTVCEHCLTPVASSSGNTSNMTARLRRQRPAGSLSGSRTAEQVPPSSEKQQTLAAFHHAHLTDSEREKKNKNTKALPLFSVSGDEGFCLCYKAAVFCTEVIPDL